MYTAHASTLPIKENCLRSQVPTWSSTWPVPPTNFTPVGGQAETQDLVHQVQVVLDWSSLHSEVQLRSDQIAYDKLQTVR